MGHPPTQLERERVEDQGAVLRGRAARVEAAAAVRREERGRADYGGDAVALDADGLDEVEQGHGREGGPGPGHAGLGQVVGEGLDVHGQGAGHLTVGFRPCRQVDGRPDAAEAPDLVLDN